jgi:hypothetical protein
MMNIIIWNSPESNKMSRVIWTIFLASTIYGTTQAIDGPGTNFDDDRKQKPIEPAAATYTPIFDTVQSFSANTTPSSTEEAFGRLKNIHETEKHTIFAKAEKLIANGLATLNIDSIHDYLEGILDGAASDSNINNLEPLEIIYPQVHPDDAPYSNTEAQLRAAIHIPTDFRYGKDGAAQPVLLVGGTGNPGYVSFSGSYVPLLQNPSTSFGDPVWLNMPGHALGDVQRNAEYVAYAIHYLSSICGGRKIAVFGYSQGNLDAQWAYKYWPSTRERVTDHVGFSPGYHGTKLTNLLALIPQPPAWLQSTYNSDLVTALRADGGDSAYVPTTVIYSATDEVVQPQTGDGASSPLNDERGVGVSNVLVQDVCPGQRAGGFYTHEGILLNPIAYALARDALLHDGPGQVSRLNLESICGHYLAPSLKLDHFVLTENSVVFAAGATLLYHGKSLTEPIIQRLCLPKCNSRKYAN